MQSPEVLSRLDALASKLGVAADHLWGVLVRQAYVEAFGSALFLVILIGVTYIAVRVIRYGQKQEWYQGYDNELQVFGTAIGIIALVVCWIIALIQLCVGVQYLANPEYFALQQVLGALK